jgi:hypothetical protein
MTRSRLSTRGTTVAVALAVVVAAPFVVDDARRLYRDMRGAFSESAYYAALPDAIARAGGRAGLLRCGAVYTAATDTQALARDLRVHQNQVGISPRTPGTIVVRRTSSLANDRRFPVVVRSGRWVVRSSCRLR